MISSRLSIISSSDFVVVGISALHAVDIVAIALLDADCRSFKAARWVSVGRTTPGPVITPGMRTTAFLSAAGEGDCCAATGAPRPRTS